MIIIILFGLAGLVALILGVKAITQLISSAGKERVTLNCPYCDAPRVVVAGWAEPLSCEKCKRTYRIVDGVAMRLRE
jgi:transposase-like protein